MALHQVIFNNHSHTQIGSCQGPQHTDRTRKTKLNHIKSGCCSEKPGLPCVLLDANFLWNGQGQDYDEAHDEEGKSVVSVPVVWHLFLHGASN